MSSLGFESCDDGIQNQGEEGVDCGGPCPPCPSCVDGVWNGGEEGVDCGGPCPPCRVGVYARVYAPTEVYPHDIFDVVSEVKVLGGSASRLDVSLTAPSYFIVKDGLQHIKDLGAGDVRNVSWRVTVGDSISEGRYSFDVDVFSVNRSILAEAHDSLFVRRPSVLRGFQKGIYGFVEKTLNVVSPNINMWLLLTLILVAIGYVYYRTRKTLK